MRVLKGLSAILRPALVLVAVFFAIGFAGVAYQAFRTLQTLAAVEADRDQWQRPADVIQPLNLKDGSVVVDFGSGAGYFALKLSEAVGARGTVIAVDLRRLSLFFLRIRALRQNKHNIRIIVGEPDDPHLAPAEADSVLIANTYHELTDRRSILDHVLRAIRPGGRLVVVDRRPATNEAASVNQEHHVLPEVVETDLRNEGFMITLRDDYFVQRPGDDPWWLIVATKPQSLN